MQLADSRVDDEGETEDGASTKRKRPEVSLFGLTGACMSLGSVACCHVGVANTCTTHFIVHGLLVVLAACLCRSMVMKVRSVVPMVPMIPRTMRCWPRSRRGSRRRGRRRTTTRRRGSKLGDWEADLEKAATGGGQGGLEQEAQDDQGQQVRKT